MTGSFSKTALEAAFNRIDASDRNHTLNSNGKSLGGVNNGNAQKIPNQKAATIDGPGLPKHRRYDSNIVTNNKLAINRHQTQKSQETTSRAQN